jgi:hypothetical protein
MSKFSSSSTATEKKPARAAKTIFSIDSESPQLGIRDLAG